MRPIKFRAMKDDMSDPSFVYGELVYTHDGVPRILTDKHRWLFNTCIKGTEGQFTGLHDKNGGEIWEGDLIRSIMNGQPIISEVFWVDDNAGFCNPSYDQPEVIGNIYENPELLEKK